MNIDRIKALAGMPANYELIEELKQQRKDIVFILDQMIIDAEKGKQIDEGLFTSLKAALSTAAAPVGAAAKKVATKAKELKANVIELYKDKKAIEELKVLSKNLLDMIKSFDKVESDSATILEKDAEIAKEVELFKTLLTKTSDSISRRLFFKYDA
jgi:hypothetical protein